MIWEPLWIDPLPWLPWPPETIPDPDPGGDPFIPSNTVTFEMSNIGGYMFPCEPNPGGLMTKTQWGGGTVSKSRRIVIHTFGSEDEETNGPLNTVIAAYRGSKCGSLVPLKFDGENVVNDNFAVPGISTKQSLVQFDVAPGKPYRVQFGSRNGAEGDIYATVSVLPPGGGLSVFLAKYGGDQWQGREYVCELGYTHAATCPSATFVVHNSTNKTLSVTPSAGLGGALSSPPAFTLSPGQAKTATFAFNTSFNQTALRTIAGYFTFSGRAGTKLVSRAYALGVVGVKSQTEYGPDVLSASVSRQVRTALINGGAVFDVKLSNAGDQSATGCHVRGEVFSRLKTSWQELSKTNPPTPAANPNVPVTIPAGGSKWLRVWVASQAPRDVGPPDTLGEIIVDCANTAALSFDTGNRFDVSALGSIRLSTINMATVAPTNGKLNVPATGLAKFRVSVTNAGPTARVRVNGFYYAPFDDAPESKFSVPGVCEANAAGKCIGPTKQFGIAYKAEKGVKKYFNVLVGAPDVDPGFDPGNRRVHLNVWQEAPDNVNADEIRVGTHGIPVKKTP